MAEGGVPESPFTLDRDGVMNVFGYKPNQETQWKPAEIKKDHCTRCNKKVYPVEKVDIGTLYHRGCFKCIVCGIQLTLSSFQRAQDSSGNKQVYCSTHVPKTSRGLTDKDAIGIKGAIDAQRGASAKQRGIKNVEGWNYDPVPEDIRRQQTGRKVKRRSTLRSFEDFEKYGVFNAQNALEKVHKEEEDALYLNFFEERKVQIDRLELQLKKEKEKTVRELIQWFDSNNCASDERKAGIAKVDQYFARQREQRLKQLHVELGAEEQDAVARMIEKHAQEMLSLIAEKDEKAEKVRKLRRRESKRASQNNEGPVMQSTQDSISPPSTARTEQGFSDQSLDQAPPPYSTLDRDSSGRKGSDKSRHSSDKSYQDTGTGEGSVDVYYQSADASTSPVVGDRPQPRLPRVKDSYTDSPNRDSLLRSGKRGKEVTDAATSSEFVQGDEVRRSGRQQKGSTDSATSSPFVQLERGAQTRVSGSRQGKKSSQSSSVQNSPDVRNKASQSATPSRSSKRETSNTPKQPRGPDLAETDYKILASSPGLVLYPGGGAKAKTNKSQQYATSTNSAANTPSQSQSQSQSQRTAAPGVTIDIHFPKNYGVTNEAYTKDDTYDSYTDSTDTDESTSSDEGEFRVADFEDDYTHMRDNKENEKILETGFIPGIGAPEVVPPKKKKSSLYTTPQVFEEFDNRAIQEAKREHKTFTDLVRQLSKKCKTELQKVRAIFRWITVKDLNKMDFDKNEPGNTLMGLLRGIKHGTESYHNLFKRMCSYAGLHCEIIEGYSKGSGYRPGMKIKGESFRNQWTAVCVDGWWRFINCNWGARHVKGPSTEKLTYKCDEFYFVTDPEDHIYQHFPDKMEWQLLRKPITLDQFLNLPLVKSPFYNKHLSFTRPYDAVLPAPDGSVEVRLQIPKLHGFAAKIKSRDGSVPSDVLDERVLIRYVEHEVVFFVNLPTPGAYYMDLFVTSEWIPDAMDHACAFMIKCQDVSSDAHVCFPHVGILGRSQNMSKLGLKDESLNDPYVTCVDETTITISMQKEDIRLWHTLHYWSPNERKLIEYDRFALLKSRSDHVATFNVNLPRKGVFIFSLFAEDPNGKISDCVSKYYIDCKSAKDYKRPYPKVSKRWKLCKLIAPMQGDLPLNSNVSFQLESAPSIEMAVVVNGEWHKLQRAGVKWQGVVPTGESKSKAVIYARFDPNKEKYIPFLEYNIRDLDMYSYK